MVTKEHVPINKEFFSRRGVVCCVVWGGCWFSTFDVLPMILDISGKITKSFFSTRCCVLCGVGLLVLDVRRLMILDISGKIITKSFFSRRGVVCCVLCSVGGCWFSRRSMENNKSFFSTF